MTETPWGEIGYYPHGAYLGAWILVSHKYLDNWIPAKSSLDIPTQYDAGGCDPKEADLWLASADQDDVPWPWCERLALVIDRLAGVEG